VDGSGVQTAFERFDITRLPAQPWKNGAGLTREIAVEPPGAGLGNFDWRVSVAEVERDAPFSAFAGVDRCIVLLEGGGLRLRSSDGMLDHRLDALDQPFFFSGDLALGAQVLSGPHLARRQHERCLVEPGINQEIQLFSHIWIRRIPYFYFERRESHFNSPLFP